MGFWVLECIPVLLIILLSSIHICVFGYMQAAVFFLKICALCFTTASQERSLGFSMSTLLGLVSASTLKLYITSIYYPNDLSLVWLDMDFCIVTTSIAMQLVKVCSVGKVGIVTAVSSMILLAINGFRGVDMSAGLVCLLAIAVGMMKLRLPDYEAVLFFWGFRVSVPFVLSPTMHYFPLPLDSLGLVLMISAAGICCTILAGVVLGILQSLIAHKIHPPTSGVRTYNVLGSSLFVAALGVCVVGGMFPVMQNLISLYDPQYPHPLIWVLYFLFPSRVLICVYWIILILVSLPVIQMLGNIPAVPQICVRKAFHLLSVILFAPIIEMDVEMLALSLAVAFCALLVVEYVRYFNVFGIASSPVGKYFDIFIDERDRSNALALTHLELLGGCAAPVWVYCLLIAVQTDPERLSSLRLLPHVGWLTVGLGDAAAAVIGSIWGRHQWRGKLGGLKVSPIVERRSVEGSLAGFTTMVVVSGALSLVAEDYHNQVVSMIIVSAFAAILETITVEADNVVMPLCSMLIYILIIDR